MGAASTNNSASRPMVPCGVVRWGCVVQGVGPQGCPRARTRRWSTYATRWTGNRSHTGLGAPMYGTRQRVRQPPLCPPRTHFAVDFSPKHVLEHESILRKGGARRATAAARRRTAGAFFVEARASSAEAASARRPRSRTPRRHHLREAPSGPRPSSGSSARSAGRPAGSSAPFYNGSAAVSARRGLGMKAGRAAALQPVAAAAAAFVEAAAPAAPSRRRTRPGT